MLRRRQVQVNRIKNLQEDLKRDLRDAKQRLSIPDHKWTYDCTFKISFCLNTNQNVSFSACGGVHGTEQSWPD